MVRHPRRKSRSDSRSPRGTALARAEAAMLAGDFDAARGLFEKALKADSGNFAAWANLGAVYQQLENADAASRALTRALAIQPDSVPVLGNLATLANQTGDGDKARDYYRRALALAPDDAELWYDLARTKRFRPDDPDLAALEAVAVAGDDDGAMFKAFALGKAYDDLGQWDRAFENLARANAIKRLRAAFDLAAEGRFARRLTESFPAAFFSERMGFGAASDAPIFILGMPPP